MQEKYFLYSGYLIISLGLSVTCGWIFDFPILTSVVPGQETMKLTTSISFVLLGFSMILMNKWKSYSVLFSLTIILIGIVQFLQGLYIDMFEEIGINPTKSLIRYVFSENHLMSLGTAICFIFSGLFLSFYGKPSLYTKLILKGLINLVTLFSIIAFLGYLFNIQVVNKSSFISSMAIHTSLAFFIISLSLSLIDSHIGLIKMLIGVRIGNIMARKLLVQMLATILILSYLRFLSNKYNLVNVEFGILIHTIAFLVITIFLIYRISIELNQIESDKEGALDNLSRIASFLDSTPDPIVVIDSNRKIRIVNHQTELVFKYKKEQLIGNKIDALLTNDSIIDYQKKISAILKSNDDHNKNLEFEMFAVKSNKTTFPIEASIRRAYINDKFFISTSIRDISIKKKAISELKKINDQNKIFIEQSPYAIAMFDNEMRYMACSKKWIEDYNLHEIHFLGESHYKVFPEIGEDWKSIHRECLNGAINTNEGAKFKRKDGSVQWISWDVRPWFKSDNDIGGLIMYTADITKIKNNETEKKKIQEILDNTSEIARIGSWEVDLISGKITWSKVTRAIHEVSADFEPILETAISFFKEGESREKIENCVSEAINHGTSYDVEVILITAKGNELWARAVGQAVFSNGKCQKLYGIFQDINDTKKTELALNSANQELDAILNAESVSIIGTDTNGIITHFNKGAEVLLQYSATEMKGKRTPALIHVEDEIIKRGNELSTIFKREISGFEVFVEIAKQYDYESREWTYVKKDGTHIPVQLVVSPLRDEKNNITGFLGIAQDISIRKESEERNKQYSILESKSKEMEQFAYIASHDLKEPLLTIKNFNQLLIKHNYQNLDDKGKFYASKSLEAANRMELLISALLDYSRLSKVKEISNVDCNKLLNSLISDLDSLIRESDSIIKYKELPVIKAYSTELKLVFQNLIQNAIKFRQVGKIPQIEISSSKINGGWQFSVKDNGIGIAKKDLEKVFIIFRRLHHTAKYEGTGIGLANVKKIIEIHNGTIWIKSQLNNGSTFHFTILTEKV